MPTRTRPSRSSRYATLTAATLVAVSAAAAGCSTDIFDVSVQLGSESFRMDFGSATGAIPSVACDQANVQVCGMGQVIALADGAGETELAARCDPSSARCYVEADTRVFYVVDVLRDEAFTSKVGRKVVSLVRMVDIAYAVPTNTATFDMPRIDLYVGPAEARAPGDAGVVLVDSVPAIPAGQSIAQSSPGHLTIADDSPAHALIESNIKRKLPFTFLLAVTPRLESGAPVPAGRMEVVLQPLLGLGLR